MRRHGRYLLTHSKNSFVMIIFVSVVTSLWPFSQDTGHIESHTFATSTLTQFCILFKRTFITICRDQVGDIVQKGVSPTNWQVVSSFRQQKTSCGQTGSCCEDVVCDYTCCPGHVADPKKGKSLEWVFISVSLPFVLFLSGFDPP